MLIEQLASEFTSAKADLMVLLSVATEGAASGTGACTVGTTSARNMTPVLHYVIPSPNLGLNCMKLCDVQIM